MTINIFLNGAQLKNAPALTKIYKPKRTQQLNARGRRQCRQRWRHLFDRQGALTGVRLK